MTAADLDRLYRLLTESDNSATASLANLKLELSLMANAPALLALARKGLDRDAWKATAEEEAALADQLYAKTLKLREQIAALREALEPFAELHRNRTSDEARYDEICVSGGLLASASKLLEDTADE